MFDQRRQNAINMIRHERFNLIREIVTTPEPLRTERFGTEWAEVVVGLCDRLEDGTK